MIVLVTGATGFVGLNIVHALLARGAAVAMFAPSLPASLATLEWLGNTRVVAGDVRSDADIARAFAAAPITHVVHAAAITPDADAEARDPAAVAAVNLEGTLRVMQVACNVGVARTLVLSSVAVYGSPTDPEPLTEDTNPAPISLYGITKLAAERAALRLAELHGLDTVAVRLGPCFGKREYRTDARTLMSPHWQVVEAALAGRECVLPRAMAADWIDAEEAGCAMADLLLAPTLPQTLFNLGGGSVTSVAAWCGALAPLLPEFRWSIDGSKPTVRIGLAHDRPAMDTHRLRRAIGWRPDSADLRAKATSYLQWRLAPEGQALVGPIREERHA